MTHRRPANARLALTVFACAMVATFVLATDSAGRAHYFGPLYADNRDQSRYYDAGFTAGARAATDWSIEYSYQPTYMYWYKTTTDIHGTNDIWYTNDPTSPGTTGETWCATRKGLSNECEHWHTVYNEAWWERQGDVPRRVLACHETGHTTGLYDGGTYGCMEQGQYWNQYLGTHNRDHINAKYVNGR